MSFEDIKLRCLLCVRKGGNAVEIKTEADSNDSNDMTECSHDDIICGHISYYVCF